LPIQTITPWLQSFAQTAVEQNLTAHMAHISKEVGVFGVPGFDVLGYDDWFKQCEHEFPQGLIKALSYPNPKIRTSTDEQILFVVLETMSMANGGSSSQALEMLLQKEGDKWLLKQLRMLPEDEARHHGLIN